MPHATVFLSLADLAGIVLAALLVTVLRPMGRGLPGASRWLAGAIASLGLLILGRVFAMELARYTGWAAFVSGPCLWLYACRLTGQTGPRGQRLAVHFIPAAAMLLVLLSTEPALAARLARPPSGAHALYLLTAVHMLAYGLLASLRLRRAGMAQLRVRLWICMGVWAVWIVLGP